MTITEECALHAIGNRLHASNLIITFDEMMTVTWGENTFNYVVVSTLNPAFTHGNDLTLKDIDVDRQYMVFVEKNGTMKCVLFR